MTLSFPNTSRSYNESKRCVSFRGYDSVFEVIFELDEAALLRMNADAHKSEAGMLAVFDRNRTRIEKAAGRSYLRNKRERLHALSAADF